MDIQRYLDRIGFSQVDKADFPTLQRLQQQHLMTVPFENLDIHLGKPIILDADTIYRKIVLDRRGGFCYELNSAFGTLLTEIGYHVTMVSGRVHTSSGGFGPEFDHMALIVHLEKDYLVDVGFGDCCRVPLPLSGDKREDISGCYRIRLRPGTEEIYALEKREDKRWKAEYLFTSTPRQLDEFTLMCEHQQTSPTSIFKQRWICTIATPTGRISVSDDHLTLTENGEKNKIAIPDEAARKELIRHYFHLDI
ncbi:arylamine N-acetyltransferase family protein [Paludifilum halophilum]|uniref:Acetyltransferase n=1 Tax=Paludifilum halophilum TaxID=1642702 RepID=A0A235B4Z9_9BACL|nr:arylamine N-acetyltransferase [Paludifilum halophilum]OYD07386.1 hypothetical protein CHM34_10775 [Paludifilum halophilum]